MIDIKQFTQRLKYVKMKDILSIPLMLLGVVLSVPFQMVHPNIWLICERENEARDNGYWFYKFMVMNHPEIESVYAINKKSIDYRKVQHLGKVIQYGSIIHWLYYFSAKWNISSQKEGKPNAALCYVLEVILGLRRNRAYIRHGISKDDQRWVYYDVTKMQIFVCSARREFNFVNEKFGYPEKNVKLIGLCRYDNLLTPHELKRQILVMPTMREWLRDITSETEKFEGSKDIAKSEYFLTWNSFIHNKKLQELLFDTNMELIFFPHAALQKYIHLFKSNCSRIHIGDARQYDVQSLLMQSQVLITDYSSVFFDFAYMKKPLIYYQFDYDKYRKGQYQEGYFSYKEDGFGPVVGDEEQLIKMIQVTLSNDCRMGKKYISRVDDFFEYVDKNNCKRTYEAISGYFS